MAISYPNGIGGTLGDSLATAHPLIISGAVWYVDTVNGTNDVSPAGQNREKPLATLAQAITNSAAADIIVVLGNSTIDLTAASVSLGSRALVGEGVSSGIPTATISVGTVNSLLMNAVGGQVRGFRFVQHTALSASVKCSITANNCKIANCYFDCGPNDNCIQLNVATTLTGVIIENCTFISTATSVAIQPLTGISIAGAQTDLKISGLVIDAGTVGFSNFYALDMATGAHVRIALESLSLLRGADISINSGATGYLTLGTVTGGSRINWT